jgi:membrane-bound lytic murein transglycosylase F
MVICIGGSLSEGSLLSAYGRSLEKIRASGEIRICLAGSSQDFYKKNAMAFAAYLGSGIHPRFVSFKKWDDQFVNRDGVVVKNGEYTPQPLASGRCDLYPNDLVQLDWRQKKLAFVLLFISRNTIIVNQRRINEFRSIKDLAGKTVAVMQGTSFESWLENKNAEQFRNNPIKFKFMPQKQAIMAVDRGEVDFAISGADGALWAINNFAKKAAVAFPVGATTKYGWCTRKADKDLQAAVRNFFDVQRSQLNSQINRNWKKYIGMTLGDFLLFVSSAPGSAGK